MSHDGKWNHVLCASCWEFTHPERGAVQVTDADSEECCRCGQETHSGIYVRAAWEDYHPGEWRDDA